MVVGAAHPALREQKTDPAAAAAPQVGAHPVSSRGAAHGAFAQASSGRFYFPCRAGSLNTERFTV